jgi:hypothetical protein
MEPLGVYSRFLPNKDWLKVVHLCELKDAFYTIVGIKSEFKDWLKVKI